MVELLAKENLICPGTDRPHTECPAYLHRLERARIEVQRGMDDGLIELPDYDQPGQLSGPDLEKIMQHQTNLVTAQTEYLLQQARNDDPSVKFIPPKPPN